MYPFILTVHVLVCLFLIFVILLQPGKGDSMGSLGGGGGGANTVFGGRGNVTFLAKITTGCAVIFMVTSLTLAYRSSHSASVLSARRILAASAAAKKAETVPATPAAPTTAPAGSTAPATPPAPAMGGTTAPAKPANKKVP